MPEETTIVPYGRDPDNTRPELSAAPANKKPIIIGIIVALLIVAFFIGLGWLMFSFPEATAILRDIVIVFMGIGTLFIILLLVLLIVVTVYLVLKVNDLVQLLDREIKPVLGKIQQTMNTVGGTTTFISEQAVQPIISTAATVAAVRTIIRSLFQR